MKKKSKTMWFPPSKFAVDAGNVSAVDNAFILENGGSLRGFSTCEIKLKPGRYKVKLLAKKTWLGRVQRTRVVTVTGDSLIIGDICYSFSDMKQDLWDKFIEDTKGFDNLKGRGVALNTGGDGIFGVEVFVEKM